MLIARKIYNINFFGGGLLLTIFWSTNIENTNDTEYELKKCRSQFADFITLTSPTGQYRKVNYVQIMSTNTPPTLSDTRGNSHRLEPNANYGPRPMHYWKHQTSAKGDVENVPIRSIGRSLQPCGLHTLLQVVCCVNTNEKGTFLKSVISKKISSNGSIFFFCLTCIEQLHIVLVNRKLLKKTKLKIRQTQHIYFIGTHKILLHYVTPSSMLLVLFKLASYQCRY